MYKVIGIEIKYFFSTDGIELIELSSNVLYLNITYLSKYLDIEPS